jgi:hypothetical protein
MAITIPEAYIQTYEARVRQLAQQGNTLLRNRVMEAHDQSKSHNWDRLAASNARHKDSVRKVSPAGGDGSGAIDTTDGLTWSRRNTLIQTYDWGEIVASEEAHQMLIDPYSSVAVNGAMAMKRQVDDIIIKAASGPAGDGKGGSVAFPTSQKIGDGTSVIDLDALLAVIEMFAKNDVDPDESKVLVIGPTQQRSLMKIMELTSADYQSTQALATGHLPNYLGFSDIIVSNRLGNTATTPAAGTIPCLAFTPKGIGLHVAGEIRANVAPRPDMSFETQFYLQLDMDAVRVEDEHVVLLDLKDSFT